MIIQSAQFAIFFALFSFFCAWGTGLDGVSQSSRPGSILVGLGHLLQGLCAVEPASHVSRTDLLQKGEVGNSFEKPFTCKKSLNLEPAAVDEPVFGLQNCNLLLLLCNLLQHLQEARRNLLALGFILTCTDGIHK